MRKIADERDFKGKSSSRGFSYDEADKLISGFVVCKEGEYFAYLNKCPHTGAPLDWVEHQFLDADSELIQCAVHDARFTIETGECVFGPCIGKILKPVVSVVIDGGVYLV